MSVSNSIADIAFESFFESDINFLGFIPFGMELERKQNERPTRVT